VSGDVRSRSGFCRISVSVACEADIDPDQFEEYDRSNYGDNTYVSQVVANNGTSASTVSNQSVVESNSLQNCKRIFKNMTNSVIYYSSDEETDIEPLVNVDPTDQNESAFQGTVRMNKRTGKILTRKRQRDTSSWKSTQRKKQRQSGKMYIDSRANNNQRNV